MVSFTFLPCAARVRRPWSPMSTASAAPDDDLSGDTPHTSTAPQSSFVVLSADVQGDGDGELASGANPVPLSSAVAEDALLVPFLAVPAETRGGSDGPSVAGDVPSAALDPPITMEYSAGKGGVGPRGAEPMVAPSIVDATGEETSPNDDRNGDPPASTASTAPQSSFVVLAADAPGNGTDEPASDADPTSSSSAIVEGVPHIPFVVFPAETVVELEESSQVSVPTPAPTEYPADKGSAESGGEAIRENSTDLFAPGLEPVVAAATATATAEDTSRVPFVPLAASEGPPPVPVATLAPSSIPVPEEYHADYGHAGAEDASGSTRSLPRPSMLDLPTNTEGVDLEIPGAAEPGGGSDGANLFERKRRQLDRVRLQKWRRMMANWEHFEQKYPGKIRQRIRRGIPDTLRGHMWMSLTGAGVAKYHNASVYHDCLLAPDSGLEETISRDISRTFPRHQQFRVTGGLGQRSMFQVLRAYSVYNPAVGYCQGMGYICALLLCYLNEEDAFWTMVSLMQKHEMEGLYREGLPKLQLYHIVLEKLMRQQLPQIASHLFDHLHMLASMFASKWLLTIFTYSFPLDVVVRIWDIFMSEGWSIIFKVALALVELLRDDILKENNFEHVLRMLEEFPLSVPGRTVISAALRVQLSNADLKVLEREALEVS